MPREHTPLHVKADGTESHESWIMLAPSKVSATPGERLFDSEITHSRYVTVRVLRCERRRELNRDWKHGTEVLMELAMSHAQWGAFVSSFGEGSGVPATLLRDQGGPVPQAPAESRLRETAREVLGSGEKALAGIQDGFEELEAAFERGAGKREMRDLIHTLKHRIGNGPRNMEFAATSLTEHVENVVTKARTDIEAMAVDAAQQGLALDVGAARLLDAGEG